MTGLFVALIVVAMMICPAAAAIQKSQLASHSPCHSEGTPPQEETTLCCCDQTAIPVDEHRVRQDVCVLPLTLPSPAVEQVLSLSVVPHIPILATEKFAKRSILRL